MVEPSGLRIILQTVFYLLVIKGALSATTHDQQECHTKTVILDCPHFVQKNQGKLTWRYFNKNTTRWIHIASIWHGTSKLAADTTLDGRLAIHPNGSLEISALNPDDETQYQCKVKQGPLKLHVIKLSVACGKTTKIEREVCVEEDVVLECDAKHRTNPRKLDQIKWQKKIKGLQHATWLLLVARNNESRELKLHGNGSLLLPRGRDESEDEFRCDATKKGNRRMDRHIIVVKSVKCRKEQTPTTTAKTTTGRVAMTTSAIIKGTQVTMETSTTSSGLTTGKHSGNLKTTKGRDAMTTAIPIKNADVAMETTTPSPEKQTTTVDHVTSTTSSSAPQSESVTRPTTQSTMVCGGVLMDPAGIFQSPNFPSAYPANSHCKWTISLPKDYAAIDITFDHLHLEHDDDCGSDYATILDELGNRVGCRLCGHHNSPVKIQVRGRVAVVVFKSDSSLQKTGFKLNYKGVTTVGEPDL